MEPPVNPATGERFDRRMTRQQYDQAVEGQLNCTR